MRGWDWSLREHILLESLANEIGRDKGGER